MSDMNQRFFMERQFVELSGHLDGFNIDTQTLPSYPDACGRLTNGLTVDDPSFSFGRMNFPFEPCDSGPTNFGLSLSLSSEGDIPLPDCDNAVIQFINQILMEEDMDEKPCMFHDTLALQAAEKSFQDVLCDKNSKNRSNLHADSLDDNFSAVSSCSAGNSSCTATSTCSSVDFQESRSPYILQSPPPENIVFQASVDSTAQSKYSQKNNATKRKQTVKSPLNELLGPNFFTDSMSMLYFQKGIKEASKFIPKGNQLMIDLDKSLYQKGLDEGSKFIPKVVDLEADPQKKMFRSSSKGMTSSGGCRLDKNEAKNLYPNELKLKKKHEREDVDMEDARVNKQMTVAVEVAVEEIELTEMFDKVLLCAKNASQDRVIQTHPQQFVPSSHFSIEKLAPQKPSVTRELVDLRSLLISCAKAVSVDDRQKASEYLKQIRQHSSPFGDGIQRLAHLFSNALEARLRGTGTQIYTALDAKRTSASEMLKAYQVYLSVFPFQRFAIIFSNHMILGCAERASKLHIIDFGILYGFQWPALIHCLARRPGGPPKLRITGIELPQRGFRPAERVQATGHRLAKYCERFGVPFEYQAIAQKWDTIRVEDLKIRKDELLAVNCLFRFKNLLDETVVHNSPRDQVLNLIKKLRPSIFVHSIVNGYYNASYFVSRFREAIFHFSPLFDAFDMKVPLENHMRLMFEKEFFGREAMNVIACEGTERVERPETYKQWQIRNLRVGLKLLPLDPIIMKKLKSKLKEGYLEDFVIDEDGQWMLQGWKGRILYASSCWVPSQ